ncbi:glycosyltransferase family 25 protein [Sulfuricurvum sp.]|uniref:glycosyltransferase family 25 protein n=1 Tax=Sulfuricurvum sp. TaxID=2025608 RepID=UPI00199E2DC6|nr:glycosyltransferase family 25 protein [Sulfuricurvum sp.]MBD3805966.1 glycosyltransferase family 25 protein [Sulfuricurvum sp.]
MKIYLISLSKDVKRRLSLQKTFPNYFKKMCQIDAIDGRLLNAKDFFSKITGSYLHHNRLLSPSELGCSLSHIKVLQEFIESGEKYALILEDDILGTDKHLKHIESLLPYIPDNSLLLCGGQDKPSLRNYLYGKEITKNLFKLAPFSHFYIVRACCYVVTHTSASAILSSHKKNILLADSWYQLLKDTNIEIFLADILSHPDNDLDSNLHIERTILTKDRRSFRQKWLSTGTLKSIANRYNLYFNIFVAIIQGYKKV